MVSSDERIGVVKIDVEGAEVHALRGMRETLGRSDRLVLFVECNPGALASANVSVSELLDELGRLRLHTQVIEEKQRSLVPATDDLTDPKLATQNLYANLLCTKGVAAAA